MSKALFLVKSPLQYLNALEAANHWRVDLEDAEIFLLSDRKSLSQLYSLIDLDGGWRRVHVFGKANNIKSRISRSIGIVVDINNWFKANDPHLLFVGDLGNPLMRHAANVSGLVPIILDDGVATLKYAQMRCQGQLDRPRLSKRMRLVLKRSVLGLRDQAPAEVTFFSCYNISVNHPDRIEINRYARARRLVRELPSGDEVYFLGGPLVEAGILDEDEFELQMKHAADCLAGQQVVYIAHRRENLQRARTICDSVGWKVRLPNLPIEYLLIYGGSRPRKIVSFVSSGLLTCKKIFNQGIEVECIRLDRGCFRRQFKVIGERIRQIEEEFFRAGIVLI